MAQRRMFNKTITNNDNFLEMPQTSQNLYFHLSMNADDDGFVDNWKSIMRMTGCKDDDLKVLISKQYIIPFESGVIVIRHWRINNYLQKDRVTPTNYQEELSKLSLENGNVYKLYTECIHSIDKNSIEKISIDKNSIKEKEEEKENIYEFIEKNFCRTLSPIEVEVIDSWEDNDLTRYAIKQAVLNGAYNIKYIDKILYNYKKNSITSVQQAQEKDKRYQNRKESTVEEIPEWFNQDLKNEELTEEEEDELDKLLADIHQKIESIGDNNA